MSKIFRFTVLCSVLLLCAAMAFAASQNAVVYGTVYDASAKPLAGVKVTLENPAISFSRTTTTAADGTYSFPEVPPQAGYKVTAAQGDRVIDIRGGITVAVGEESVIFPALKAQAAAKAVETSAKEMAVTTEKISGAQSGVITGEQLRSLPLYNRNFLTLGTLTPNTHPSAAHDPLGEASFSVAGNRSTGNSFLIDGADNRASSSNQAVPFQVNDAIQEFSVISSAGNAEYGANGGTVNVATKRGGNNWHGTAFGYFGADSLNSDGPLSVYNGSTFDKAAGYADNPLGNAPLSNLGTPVYYNQYVASAESFGWCTDQISLFTGVAGPNACTSGAGGTGFNTLFDPAAVLSANNNFTQPWMSQQFGANIGGPIMKNKLFVFAGYEGTHIDNPNPIFERVPSTFDKTYDPFGAGMGFSSSDPNYTLAQGVLGLFPTSNVVGVPGVLEFYKGEAPNYTWVHNGIGRVDWVAGPKDSFGMRYVGQLLNQLHDDTLPASGTYAGNGAYRDAFNSNLNVSYTHVFSSTLLNEAHAGFNRFDLKETAQDAGFDGTSIGLATKSLMSFYIAGIDPQYSGAIPATNGAIGGWDDSCYNGAVVNALPSGNTYANCFSYAPTMDGLYPFARIGAPQYAPSVHEDISAFVSDSVAWTKGRHQFKFGAEYRHFNNNLYDAGLSRGFVLAPNIGQFTHAAEDCNENCDLAFEFPSFDYAQKNFAPIDVTLMSHEVGLYAEDTIHAYSRLTVTLGLRWEYYSQPLDQNNQLWNFDPLANGLVQQGQTTVINQINNPCFGTGTGTQFTIDPGWFGGFFPGSNTWDCQMTGVPGANGFNRTSWTNFMPRVGMAWDIFGNGNTVARFGVGMFYDRAPSSYAEQLAYNRPITPLCPDSDPTCTVSLGSGFGNQLPQAMYGGLFNGTTTLGAWGNSNLDPNVMVNDCCVNGQAAPVYMSAVQPSAIYAQDAQSNSPARTWQLNASIQHQFSNKFVAELGYVGTYGGHLPVFYNQGFNNEWFCNSSSFSGACDNNSFAPVYMQTNRGESQYNSVFLRARLADWHGLRLNGTYTWSQARDNAASLVFPTNTLTMFNWACGEQINVADNPFTACGASFLSGGGSGSLSSTVAALTTTGAGQAITTPYLIPQDSGNFLRNDYGRSDYNSTHRFVVDWTYDVPSLQKMWGWSKWLDYWQLSGTAVAQSGQPYTIFSLLGGELSQRVDATGAIATSTNPNSAISLTNISLPLFTCGPATPDSSSGFLFAADGSTGTSCNGNTQRNGFNGPMYSTINVAIQKGFPIGGEGKMLSLRSEVYNLFGADNFYNPVSLITTDGFTLNPDFGKIKSAHDPRQVQFGVRFTW